MPTTLLAALIFASATAGINAQSSATTPSSGSQPTLKGDTALTLVGCVQRDETRTGDWFTLSDKNTRTTYHLTGSSVKAFVWRNVRIVGGLVPSPNIAAQAGAIDPSKTAMAYQGANPPGTGNVEPLEFNVTRVRRLTGSCAPKSDR